MVFQIGTPDGDSKPGAPETMSGGGTCGAGSKFQRTPLVRVKRGETRQASSTNADNSVSVAVCCAACHREMEKLPFSRACIVGAFIFIPADGPSRSSVSRR